MRNRLLFLSICILILGVSASSLWPKGSWENSRMIRFQEVPEAIHAPVGELFNDEGQEVLKYKASDLVGYVWMWLEFLENNDTVTHPNMPVNYTLEFMPDGQVVVQADCNRANGTYTVNGGQLDIEIMTTTLAACPEGSLENEYLQLLNDAAAYIREGDLLFIDIMMDAGTMKFLPME